MKEKSSPFDAGSGTAGQPYRKTLTSVKGNLLVETWEATAEDITPGAPAWSVKKMTFNTHAAKDILPVKRNIRGRSWDSSSRFTVFAPWRTPKDDKD